MPRSINWTENRPAGHTSPLFAKRRFLLDDAYSAGFHIDDEDLEGLLSVRDAVNYVADKLQVT